MGIRTQDSLRRSYETLGFRQTIRHLVFQAKRKPLTPENFSKFLKDLSELCRKSLRGEEFLPLPPSIVGSPSTFGRKRRKKAAPHLRVSRP